MCDILYSKLFNAYIYTYVVDKSRCLIIVYTLFIWRFIEAKSDYDVYSSMDVLLSVQKSWLYTHTIIYYLLVRT